MPELVHNDKRNNNNNKNQNGHTNFLRIKTNDTNEEIYSYYSHAFVYWYHTIVRFQFLSYPILSEVPRCRRLLTFESRLLGALLHPRQYRPLLRQIQAP